MRQGTWAQDQDQCLFRLVNSELGPVRVPSHGGGGGRRSASNSGQDRTGQDRIGQDWTKKQEQKGNKKPETEKGVFHFHFFSYLFLMFTTYVCITRNMYLMTCMYAYMLCSVEIWNILGLG